MNTYKEQIQNNICYTKLVYGRINKKLNLKLSKVEIEKMVMQIILETNEAAFQKTGKNIYISNREKNIRLTVNSLTNRIITADKLSAVLKH